MFHFLVQQTEKLESTVAAREVKTKELENATAAHQAQVKRQQEAMLVNFRHAEMQGVQLERLQDEIKKMEAEYRAE